MTDTPATLVDRARGLRDRLRELQEEHAIAGGYGVEIHEALRDAGLYRVLTPRRFGGLEQDLETFLRVGIEIARGDPAVGWSYTLGAARSFHVASYFPEEAQRALFAVGDLISPGRVAPTGHAEATAGGHRLSGTWQYCSGSTWSTHVLVAATVSDAAGSPQPPRFFAVPRSGYQVLDDWGGAHVLGMAASGSNSVRIDDVLVPEGFSVPAPLMMEGPTDLDASPGYVLHGNPTYLGRPQAFFAAELVASQVGAARAAADEYETLMRTKRSAFPPFADWADSDVHHQRYGTILALTDAAEELLLSVARRVGARTARWAQEGEVFAPVDDQRLQAVAVQAGELADRAVDLALTGAGTAATRHGSRLATYHRDATTYRTHLLAQADQLAVRLSREILRPGSGPPASAGG